MRLGSVRNPCRQPSRPLAALKRRSPGLPVECASRAPVAQPDRVVASEAIGRGFESLRRAIFQPIRQSAHTDASMWSRKPHRQALPWPESSNPHPPPGIRRVRRSAIPSLRIVVTVRLQGLDGVLHGPSAHIVDYFGQPFVLAAYQKSDAGFVLRRTQPHRALHHMRGYPLRAWFASSSGRTNCSTSVLPVHRMAPRRRWIR